jgi:hypothetical protein
LRLRLQPDLRPCFLRAWLFDTPSLHLRLRTRFFYTSLGFTLALAHLLPARHYLGPLKLRLRLRTLKLRLWSLELRLRTLHLRLRTLHLRLRPLHLRPSCIRRWAASLLRRTAAVAAIAAAPVAFPLPKGSSGYSKQDNC